ncbi:Ig-like domain-containing protein, partial [Escherichia coli]|uniref:Ig-like domain-containing protein n=1 Tax=Escherichia coli TaxID=562 RepID=UPI00201F987C
GSDAAKDAAQLTLTAGAPHANSSTVTLAATSLTVGDTHTTTATWTVKDEHNNPVTGLTDATLNVTSQTEGVTVTATAWAEDINSPGTYTATVTAGDKAGTVRLMPQVNGSDAAKDAAQLTLTAGDMVADKSTVSVQPASIKADGAEATTVTYQARDAHGNLVPLQATDVTLSVSGVDETTFSGFTESVPGVYVGTLTGTRTGTASLMPQVNGSDAAKEAAQLMLTAGAPVSNTSSISTNKTGYTVGESMTVTVMLKDAQGNPVSDKESDLASAVTVPNASRAGDWAEAPGTSGTYTATYTATGAGEDLKAELMLSGWTVAKKADSAYTITEPQPRAMTGTITANGKSDFSTTATTKFPTTGFKGAYFTLNDDNFQGGVGNYTLKASCGSDPNECDWVSVDNDGKVTFDGDATTAKKTVTITAMPKNGGDPLTYKFTVSRWFTNQGPSGRNWTDTNEACTTAGLALPPPEDLSGEYGVKPKRVIGSLWGEWGDFSNWRAQGWSIGLPYWTAVARSQDAYFYVYLTDGAVGYNLVTVTATYGVCVRGL